MTKSIFNILISTVITALITGYLISFIDFNSFIDQVSDINIFWIFIGIVSVFLSILTSSLVIFIIFDYQENINKCNFINSAHILGNAILPLGSGELVFTSLAFKMIKSPFNYILSRQVVILYQSAILMIAFIVMWFVALYFNGYFKIAFNLFIGFIIFIFLFYPNFFFKLIINPFLFFLHKTKDINFLNKITLKIEDFQINIFKLQDSYLKIKVILLNFSHLIFGALAVFFIMKAFAIDGNILLAFAIIASISWIKILMGFTLGGLGTSEFGIALLFVLLGVPLEAAVQDAIIIRVSLLITTVVLGLISLLFSWYFLE